MPNVQIFSESTIFNIRINKNAMKVKMNCRRLVILFKHIKLGLCEVTKPKNGYPPLFSIFYYTNICNFII